MFVLKDDSFMITEKSVFSKLKTSIAGHLFSKAYCIEETTCSISFTLLSSMKIFISSYFFGKTNGL